VPSLCDHFHMWRKSGQQLFFGDILIHHKQSMKLMNLSLHLLMPMPPMFKRQTLKLDDSPPFFKFAMYDEGDISYCFGSKPWFKGNNSPTGQAKQVFIVYDPILERCVKGGGRMGNFHMPSDLFFQQLVDPPLPPS
jgi:hypothetical protein